MAEESLPVFFLGCVQCGKTVAGTEGSCPRCGTSFDDLRFECPFCGKLVSPSDTKCPSCNTEFSVFAAEVSDASNVDLDGPEDGSDAEVVERLRTCSKCGKPVPADSQGCPECSKDDAGTEYECPSCGGAVSDKDVVCPKCGARFG